MLIYTNTFDDGVLVRSEVIDTDARTLTIYEHGVETSTRPLTDEENEALDARLAAQVDATLGNTDAMVSALLREFATAQDPTTAPPWVQPTGAHDAYLPGALVAHNAIVWRNDLTVLNVWEPGTQNAGWTDVSTPPPDGPQPWVQPTGSTDAYNVGDVVTHNGQTWVSTVAANVWEPGVYGWDVTT